MDGNGSLTPGDALCVFNTYLNGQVVPGSCDAVGYDCEGPAADADCSGLVTPGDALAVYQRYLLGQPVEECLGQAGPALAASDAAARVITSRRVDAGEVELSLAVDPTAHFDAFGVRVSVPAGFELADFDRGAATSDWMLVDARTDDDGTLWVGGFDTRGLDTANSTELFRLRFRAVGLEGDPNQIRFIDFVDDLAGAVEDGGAAPAGPSAYRLYQNHPNPFNPQTSIRFDVPAEAGRVPVTLAIYSVRGERVRTLVDEDRAPGAYHVVWDGRDQNGVTVGSGVYFYSLRAGTFQSSRRMVLLK
jgi:hypothetical protein